MRRPTLTERKPPPTGVVIGPFSAVPFCRIDSSTWSGSGLPPFWSITSLPACWTSQSNSTPGRLEHAAGRLGELRAGPVAGDQCHAMRHPARTLPTHRRAAVAGNVLRDGRPQEVRRALRRLRRGDEHLLDRPRRGRAHVPRLRHRRARGERELRGGRVSPARGRPADERRARRVQGAAGLRPGAAARRDDDHRRERDGRLADGDAAHRRLGALLLRPGRGRDRPRERAPQGRHADRPAADDRRALRAPPPRRARPSTRTRRSTTPRTSWPCSAARPRPRRRRVRSRSR